MNNLEFNKNYDKFEWNLENLVQFQAIIRNLLKMEKWKEIECTIQYKCTTLSYLNYLVISDIRKMACLTQNYIVLWQVEYGVQKSVPVLAHIRYRLIKL